MRAFSIIGALGLTLTNAADIVCDKPYGCAGHNINTMNCDENEHCDISCSADYACKDLDIYGPEITDESNTNERLSLTMDCSAEYSCYGSTIHTTNLDTITITCSDWWSCAYMTIEGQTANQVFVYVPEDGYYSFGSGRVYCPLTENDDSSNNNNDNSIVSESSVISCSVECSGDRACYHSKFHNDKGLIDNSLVIGCNGQLACNYAKLHCNYDSENDEWSNDCTMSCEDDVCACASGSDCIQNTNNNNEE